ncbi:uncharacterized protein LOC106463764 [Limulus polyphemus]|uniref:Small ribosomal subunit protein mS26 n=1 Tax=Limulus polyphemus TaxID=6850 RepID=A0ABM1BCL4_LIMPO|nr:uncharacterized protein LOC106463764 [Limulus polyphemus]
MLENFTNFRLLRQITRQIQFIRYKKRPTPARKNIWEPPAPSKYFRISPRPVIPVKEQEELKHLYDIYRTHFRALRHFFQCEYEKTTRLSIAVAEKMKEEVSEHAYLMEQNKLENERVAEIRKARRKCDMAKLDDELSQAEQSLSQLIQEERKKLDELVLKEKKMNSTYITSQTLETAIEDALDNLTTYDFAIDLNGVIYRDDKKESTYI